MHHNTNPCLQCITCAFLTRIAILGGGASAFDNAQYSLKSGVGAVEVFVRRPELPRINPIRFMEFAGFLHHFADLDDATKYAGIDFFMQVRWDGVSLWA